MDYFQAVILGIVEGLTEFLPVSSTGHLTIAEQLLGLQVDDPAVTAFTAVIQMGAIAAVVLYFCRDIWRIAKAWATGLVKPELRGTFDHRMGWYVIVGSIPIGVVGLLAKDLITGPLRSLWVVAVALILWSGVMLLRRATRPADARGEGPHHAGRDRRRPGPVHRADPGRLPLRRHHLGGPARAASTGSPRPGSRSSCPSRRCWRPGSTSSRTRSAGDIGIGQTVVGTVVSFVVAYASIAWLLRFVAGHSIGKFVPYRVGLGVLLIVALSAGWITAT